jgi:hypothetical protein
MSRLSRAGIAVVLLAGVLWAGGVAEAGNLLPTVTVCVDASSGVVSRVASSTKCVGDAQSWSVSQSAPLLCWNASSLDPQVGTRKVSIAPSSGCVTPLRSVPVGSAQLLCAGGKTGVLRWPVTGSCRSGATPIWVRSAATSTTVPTTTSTTSTTAVVVPSVSLLATTIQSNAWPKAVTVTANVAGTVYFAEGDFVVKTVSDITSAPSHRWAKGTVTSANTPTSIAIDGDVLTNGYYRVFVANSQGVLSAPATNILTISIPRASTATTTPTVALTCATGGSCTVGVDTGPGGGIVFYYSATAFTSIGSDCGTNCHYLEAAPSVESSHIVGATADVVCYAGGSTLGTSDCQSNSIYSGDSSAQAASRTAATGIGMGLSNTNQAYARLTTVGFQSTTQYAAGIAWRYANNSKTDWFLPSKDELNEMCKYAKNTGQVSGGGTRCDGGSEASGRGFLNTGYWSSSELDATALWAQNFDNGYQGDGPKHAFAYVRPVRAF